MKEGFFRMRNLGTYPGSEKAPVKIKIVFKCGEGGTVSSQFRDRGDPGEMGSSPTGGISLG